MLIGLVNCTKTLCYLMVSVVIYTVEIHTGDLPGSDTSAQAYIQLMGTRGDSGRRLLFKDISGNKKKFQKGQMDIFEIEAVSLDDISSVILGHNGHGKGKLFFNILQPYIIELISCHIVSNFV